MKKSLSLLALLLTACLLLSACGNSPEETTTISTTTANTTGSTPPELFTITVQSKNTNPNTEFELSADKIATVVSIWDNGNWKPYITKTGYDYVFVFSDTEIRYSSEVGIFNDPDNNRHLELTEEQRIWVNSFLE
ncbi:MAG: hypothetical protein IJW62_05905 [Clostridia bacterium]|nr:hypothetical protein [Clostridia bacterium]